MSEVIIFADAAATVIDFLAAGFAERDEDAEVLPRTPNPRPERFVVVDRTGGVSRSVVVDHAQVTVESWGTSDEDAHDLAQLCRGLLLSRPYRVVEISGPANLPDDKSDHPRYSQTFLVAMRGAAEILGS